MLKLIRGRVVVKSLDQQRYYKLTMSMAALPSEDNRSIWGWTIREIEEPRMMRAIGEPFATVRTKIIFPPEATLEKAIAEYEERTH